MPGPGRWHAHLSLASHDLVEPPDLRHEVWSYTAGLPIPVPQRFTAEIVALYRLAHHSWSGPWWTRLHLAARPQLAPGRWPRPGYRGYAAGTPPSTLSTLPVLLPDRRGDAKCSTASAMSSGRMFTRRVVRCR